MFRWVGVRAVLALNPLIHLLGGAVVISLKSFAGPSAFATQKEGILGPVSIESDDGF